MQMAVAFVMEGSTLATMAGSALQASVPLAMSCSQMERRSALSTYEEGTRLPVPGHPAAMHQPAPSMLLHHKALQEATLRMTSCALHISVRSCGSCAPSTLAKAAALALSLTQVACRID